MDNEARARSFLRKASEQYQLVCEPDVAGTEGDIDVISDQIDHLCRLETLFAEDPVLLNVFHVNSKRTLYPSLTEVSIEDINAIWRTADFWILPRPLLMRLEQERAARQGPFADLDSLPAELWPVVDAVAASTWARLKPILLPDYDLKMRRDWRISRVKHAIKRAVLGLLPTVEESSCAAGLLVAAFDLVQLLATQSSDGAISLSMAESSKQMALRLAVSQGWLATVQSMILPARHSASFGTDEATAAAAGGHVAILQWVYEQTCMAFPAPKHIFCRVTEVAAACGHMDVIKWYLDKECGEQWQGGECTRAAGRGLFDALKWLHLHGAPWDSETSAAAASIGRLDILQFLAKNGCDWKHADTCSSAARGGHLAVLLWAHEHECPWDSETCLKAAEGGHLAVLQWVRSQDLPCPWDPYTCSFAAMGGHLHVLKWCRDNGCPIDTLTCPWAASGGYLDILQWARGEGVAWDKRTCDWAAANGQMLTLQWARRHGCPWDASTCAEAAHSGHLAILKWLRCEGCPWNAWTCARAAESGELGVLQWARENGCPWDESTCFNAAMGGNLGLLQWARANGCPWSCGTCIAAATAGHLPVLQWALSEGCPCNGEVSRGAASNGHEGILKWLSASRVVPDESEL